MKIIRGSKKKRAGRPPIHGGYSVKAPSHLIRGAPAKRLRDYINTFREGLYNDLGGFDRITTAQTMLIDRAASKLVLLRLIEIFITEAGPWEARGKLRPVLAGPYLSYSHSIREDLRLLGIERRAPLEVIALPWEEPAKPKRGRLPGPARRGRGEAGKPVLGPPGEAAGDEGEAQESEKHN